MGFSLPMNWLHPRSSEPSFQYGKLSLFFVDLIGMCFFVQKQQLLVASPVGGNAIEVQQIKEKTPWTAKKPMKDEGFRSFKP